MMLWKIGIVCAVAAVVVYLMQDEEFQPDSLIGKKVLVTGASSGIGRDLAINYCRMGASVVITARREANLKEVVSECRRIGRPEAPFAYIVADMMNYETESIKLIRETVAKLNGLDHLVLNHALMSDGYAKYWSKETPLPVLKAHKVSMDVNFNSFVHIYTAALPHLARSDAAHVGIINSMSGKLPSQRLASYSASKFALDGFFGTMRQELKAQGLPVTVTNCFLGAIATDKMKETMAIFTNNNNYDFDKALSMIGGKLTDVNDTAMAVIAATSRGDAELYYPPFYGMSPKVLSVARSLRATLFDFNMDEMFKKD